jgi:hypothetical protein
MSNSAQKISPYFSPNARIMSKIKNNYLILIYLKLLKKFSFYIYIKKWLIQIIICVDVVKNILKPKMSINIATLV